MVRLLPEIQDCVPCAQIYITADQPYHLTQINTMHMALAGHMCRKHGEN